MYHSRHNHRQKQEAQRERTRSKKLKLLGTSSVPRIGYPERGFCTSANEKLVKGKFNTWCLSCYHTTPYPTIETNKLHKHRSPRTYQQKQKAKLLGTFSTPRIGFPREASTQVQINKKNSTRHVKYLVPPILVRNTNYRVIYNAFQLLLPALKPPHSKPNTGNK